jgi:protein N-terminal amidase
MDINQYQFSAPWEAYEFANHCIKGKAPLIVLSTAWLTHATLEMLAETPTAPDLDTVGYWHARLRPLTELAEGECTTVVFANRVRTEVNENRALVSKNGQVVDLGEQVSYAGSSCVMQFTESKTYIFDVLGKAEEGLLVVDTLQVSASVLR